ncbi:MAG: thioredoxin family protein [Planctomycetes bacterium]|nr:thioredoxin family protein [Planctomycetota bacterium]
MRKFITLAALSALLVFTVDAAAKDKLPPVLKVGAKAPQFVLKDLNGKEVSLEKVLEQKKIVVLEWFNPGCPYVKKHHARNTTMKDLAAKYKDKVVWLAINSSSKGKQGYGVELNKKSKKDWKIAYPILLDSDGKVGRKYGARRTPHMYVITPDGLLAYVGAIDNNNSGKTAGEINYVNDAITAILAGKAPETKRTKSYGCGVKYGKRHANK